MLAFSVSLDRRPICTAGVRCGVLTASVTWVRRAWPKQLELRVGALDSETREHLDWRTPNARVGSSLFIEIVETEAIDPVVYRHPGGNTFPEFVEHRVRAHAYRALREPFALTVDFARGVEKAVTSFVPRSIGLRATLNGRSLAAAGGPRRGVLTALLTHVTGRREARLALGGLDTTTNEHLDWCSVGLRVGDSARIDILPGHEATDPPATRRAVENVCARRPPPSGA